MLLYKDIYRRCVFWYGYRHCHRLRGLRLRHGLLVIDLLIGASADDTVKIVLGIHPAIAYVAVRIVVIGLLVFVPH